MTPEKTTAPRTSLPRVLIVDDDATLAQGLKRAIESQGYVVQTVDGGVRALKVAATFQPDLVVLDVMMPVLDGWEVLARLRASQGTAHLPVIMLTAADSDTAKVKGFQLGADDYVTKPFSVQELRWRIAAILRRARPETHEEETLSIPEVAGGGSALEFIRCRDVYYVEGVRNYTYVHTADSRFLSRLTLGALEEKALEGLKRVHRSYIVNMNHVKGCGWANKSSYRLRLSDLDETEVPVSRALVAEVQHELGLKP